MGDKKKFQKTINSTENQIFKLSPWRFINTNQRERFEWKYANYQ